MNTTLTPTTSATESAPQPGPRRRWRYWLTGLVAFSATIALFYAEENWRGWRAWENCQRDLAAKGARLDWAYYIPPAVPEDENIFGAPEMRQWFEGREATGSSRLPPVSGWDTNLSSLLRFPGWDNNANARLVVANVTIGLPGSSPPSGSTVLQWLEGTNARAEASRLIKQSLGLMAADPAGYGIMVKKPEEVRPPEIFLQCQTAPTLTELQQFLPSSFAPTQGWNSDDVRIEQTSSNSFRETMHTPVNAAEYVAWSATIEPKLAIIRQAVQRPYARLAGDYSNPLDMPIPNFVSVRNLSQRLAALAECYMVLGQPEKALDQLTFLHQLCHLLEARPTGRPMTLVAAMINVAVTGLYVGTIQDGMRMQVWREPQLAALQEQLQEINLRPYVVDAFAFEQVSTCAYGQKLSAADLLKLVHESELPAKDPKFTFFSWILHGLASHVSLARLIPQGWMYQNLVVNANLHQLIISNLGSADQLVEPRKLAAIQPAVDRVATNPSPFNVLASIAIPNFSRAFQTTAHNQTLANQAQIACALERYRLAHGEYPSSLEALKPQFIAIIPLDLIGGRPPHYRRTSDGKFLLYSIGWSETDHGGHSDGDWWNSQNDWVWMDEETANSPAGQAPAKLTPATTAPPYPPALDTNLAAGNEIMETVQFDQVSLSNAVAQLAKQAQVKLDFDPVIVNQKAADGTPMLSSSVREKWKNVTAWQTLQALLDNFGWQMTVTPGPAILVNPKDTNVIGPLEMPVNPTENSATNGAASADAEGADIAFHDVPVGEAIRQVAILAGLNIQFDPRLASQLNVALNEKWTNMTPLQALQRLLDSHGWQMIQIPGNPILRIVPKNP